MLGVAACMVIRGESSQHPVRERTHWWIDLLVLGGFVALFFWGLTDHLPEWRRTP